MKDAAKANDRDPVGDESKRLALEKAEEIDRMYEPGARPTTVVPGTHGMVSGTAFADMAEDRATDENPDAGGSDVTPRGDRSRD